MTKDSNSCTRKGFTGDGKPLYLRQDWYCFQVRRFDEKLRESTYAFVLRCLLCLITDIEPQDNAIRCKEMYFSLEKIGIENDDDILSQTLTAY